MDFLTALKYPFNSIAKVFSIVLVMTIAFALCLALIIGSYDWSSLAEAVSSGVNEALGAVETSADAASHDLLNEEQMEGLGVGLGRAALGLLGLVIVSIVGGFWFSGYSVDVVRAVMAGQDVLPAVEFGRNMRAGFTLFLSAVLYGLLFVVYLIVVGLLSNLGGLFVFIAVIAAIPFLFVMGWGYYIGMARYAAENDPGAVFQIWKNMKTARANIGPGVSLAIFQILLGIIYNIGTRVLDGLINGITGAGGVVLTALVISAIVFFALNLFQHFSAQHLIAQYAMRIGIGGPGPKDKVDFD